MIHWQRVAGTAAAGLLIVTLAPSGGAKDEPGPARALYGSFHTLETRALENDDEEDDEGLAPCIAYWTQVSYRNYGYDHWVIIRNDCEATATCEVETNVNPNVIETRVPAGEKREILTYRGSPSRHFTATVTCELGNGTR